MEIYKCIKCNKDKERKTYKDFYIGKQLCRKCYGKRVYYERKSQWDLTLQKRRNYYAENRESFSNRHKARSNKAKQAGIVYGRKSWLKRKYGVTEEWYAAKLAAQNNACAICKRTVDELGVKNLCVDHCHTSNLARDLLCISCNAGLGFIERPEYKLALEYLERHKIEQESSVAEAKIRTRQ